MAITIETVDISTLITSHGMKTVHGDRQRERIIIVFHPVSVADIFLRNASGKRE